MWPLDVSQLAAAIAPEARPAEPAPEDDELEAFRAPEQRCRCRELRSGAVLVDDSSSASSASVAAALDVLGG